MALLFSCFYAHTCVTEVVSECKRHHERDSNRSAKGVKAREVADYPLWIITIVWIVNMQFIGNFLCGVETLPYH